MNLITWNCNMAFRKKIPLLLTHKPDILVIPECEHPDKLQFTEEILPNTSLWHGSNPHKGLGVFAYGPYQLHLLENHQPNFKNILPIAVTGGCFDFILLAVWANNPEDKDGPYITQLWKALAYYEELLHQEIIIMGDFNSNTIWDKPKRVGNHSEVVSVLEQKGIQSVYHTFHQQTQGQEQEATFYLYRHLDKPYHLDYCFASKRFTQQVTSIKVGKPQDWLPYSDHVPLFISFKD